MTKLPRGLSGKAVVTALEKAGFYFKRRKGSHIVMRRDTPFAQVVVPDHKKHRYWDVGFYLRRSRFNC